MTIVYHITKTINVESILQYGIIAKYKGKRGLGDNVEWKEYVFTATSVDLILNYIGIRGSNLDYSVITIDLPNDLIERNGYWEWEKLIKNIIPHEYILDIKGLENYV